MKGRRRWRSRLRLHRARSTRVRLHKSRFDRSSSAAAGSERESRYELAITGLAIERCRVDVAPSRSRLARSVPGLRLRRNRQRRVREIRPVEDVEEFRTDLKRLPFPDAEHPAEAHLLGGSAFIPEVAIERRGRTPGSRRRVYPCGRIQDKVLVRIDAVAVQVLQEQGHAGNAA